MFYVCLIPDQLNMRVCHCYPTFCRPPVSPSCLPVRLSVYLSLRLSFRRSVYLIVFTICMPLFSFLQALTFFQKEMSKNLIKMLYEKPYWFFACVYMYVSVSVTQVELFWYAVSKPGSNPMRVRCLFQIEKLLALDRLQLLVIISRGRLR